MFYLMNFFSPFFNNFTLNISPKLIYFLALQKCGKNTDYTIHGLWVDFQSGGYPEFCKKVEFNVDLLDSIRKDLDENWPTCFNGANEGLWKHEFLKHATCMEHVLPQFLYFNATLNIFHNLKHNLDELCNDTKNCLIQVNHDDIHGLY